jgi:MFS family permease
MSSGAVWRYPGMPSLLVVSFAGFAGYAVLLAVAPLWAVRGGAGVGGAGLVNAVLLLTTVAVQTFVPWFLDRFGYTPVIVAGLLFLGAPALGYGLSAELGPVLAMSALRGVGFAVLTVVGSALVAQLIPAGRLGAAIGVYGLAVAVPMLVLLPLSVPIADGLGFTATFVLGALPLLGIPAAVLLGRALRVRGRPRDPVGAGPAPAAPAATVRTDRRELARRLGPPMIILLSVTLSGGAIITFLPQLVGSSGLAAVSLFLLSLSAALTRWLVGGMADRTGPKPYLAPLLLLTAAGMLALGWWASGPGSTWVLLPAVVAVGAGYGALQNLTLVASFQQVSAERVNVASATWNIGFDAGTGLGALVTGYLATGFSFPVAFVVLAVITVLAVATVRGISPARTGDLGVT